VNRPPILAVLFVVAVLLLGWFHAEGRLFDVDATAPSRLKWLIRALVGSIVAFILVFALMVSQQRRLSRAAKNLAHQLESYVTEPSKARPYVNPHLVSCREVFNCKQNNCVAFDQRVERCWQALALRTSQESSKHPHVALERCHQCEVFRASTPNSLSLLGESYNNLLFLLKQEAVLRGQLHSEMVEREKMFSIGQLASGFAHEVGNPLSSISSIVQILRRTRPDEEMDGQLALIETHIQRITGIVHQLARLVHHRSEHRQWVDLGRALADAVELVSFDRRANNVRIIFTPPTDLPRISGIPGQVDQVFLNLLLNALDAMPDGGTLKVHTRRTESAIVIDIEDTGSGIAQALGRGIFDPFFTTKDPGKGTGLGLAVCESIVRGLGGTVNYKSRVGTGTRFTVSLPIQTATAGPLI
jgi:signal transduction histidine kinase